MFSHDARDCIEMELPGASSKAICQPVPRSTVLIGADCLVGTAAVPASEKKTRRDSYGASWNSICCERGSACASPEKGSHSSACLRAERKCAVNRSGWLLVLTRK